FKRNTELAHPSGYWTCYLNDCSNMTRVSYQQFDMRTASGRSDFVQAINKVPNGNFICLDSRGAEQKIKQWEPSVKAAFLKIGTQMFDTMKRDSTAFV